MAYYLLPLIAYLIGSVSTAIITCKLMSLPDPRSCGSKNPGTTNVLRLGGKKAAAITLIGDVLKGLLPTMLTALITHDPTITALSALAAFLGHIFPLYYGFSGGKGVATAIGAVFGLSWLAGLMLATTWLMMGYLFKISSLAALIAFVFAPAFLWLNTHELHYCLAMCVITLMIAFRHKSNIQRILNGTEPRIGRKA